MNPNLPQNPGLMQVANQAQYMARQSREDRMAVAFQTVAMVSMAIVGVSAAARLLHDLLSSEKHSSRSR